MNVSFFETTLAYDWMIPSGNHPFDPIKVKKYLEHLSEPDRGFIAKLLQVTTYISFDQLYSALNRSLDAFQDKMQDRPFYLFLQKGRIGSEHWITALLWSRLRRLPVIEIINEKSVLPLEKADILILDDMIYSGIRTISKIDELTYDIAKILKINQRDVGEHLTFHLVIPFVTSSGLNLIAKECRDYGCRGIVYLQITIPLLSDLVTIEDYYNPSMMNKVLFQRFDIDNPHLPACYFDHKVAGDMSTFESIYLYGRLPNQANFGSLFKENPSRDSIERLKKLFEDWRTSNDR